MFHDLDTALMNLLDDAGAPTTLQAAGVAFETPDRKFKPQSPTSAVNLFLVEVTENRELRDPVPVRLPRPDGYRREAPPLRVDCRYVVTAWGDGTGAVKVKKEHELLALAFRWLSRFPTLPEDCLVGTLVNQPYPPPTLVAQLDGGRNMGEFWSALGIPPRPYFNLVVTIAMDLGKSVQGALVTTAAVGYSQTHAPASREERVSIGGTVLTPTREPVADAWVLLEPDGIVETTDALGRFVFGGIARGSNYTLTARALGLGQERRTNVSVPSPSGEYDIQFP